MIKFVIYLLESSALLAVFYFLYVAVMKKETFFELNRFFLLGIVVFSLLFPLMSFDLSQGKIAVVDTPVEEFSKLRMSYYEAMSDWEYENFNNSDFQNESKTITNGTGLASIDWVTILMKLVIGIYAIGIVFCLSKIFLTVRWLSKTIKMHPHEQIDGVNVVKMPNPIAPFSFLKYAFVHQEIIGTPELDQIIAHEKTHIDQNHSVDLIFVQFLAAFLWFNPLIWRLIKSLKTTHEYIADKKIINSGYSLVEYQTLLLRQLISNNSYGLVHNFNLSFIKKRITMMKNNQSGFAGKVRVALTIACAVVLSLVIVQCNSRAEEEISLEPNVTTIEDANSIDLPTLPDIGNNANFNQENAVTFSITNDQLMVDGKPYENGEIKVVIETSKIDEQGVIILKIDRDQSMKKVREVQTELRRENRRKVLYIGQTASGKQVQSPMLLPPLPGDMSTGSPQLAKFDLTNAVMEGNIAKLDGREFLKVDLGNNKGVDNQKEVYDFVKSHFDRASASYVISAKYDDEISYGSYLTNLVYVQEGFNQLYQKRAQDLFGVDFYDLEKAEYQAVRKGIPRAISIAEE